MQAGVFDIACALWCFAPDWNGGFVWLLHGYSQVRVLR